MTIRRTRLAVGAAWCASLASSLWLTSAAAAAPPPEEDYVLHCSGCHRLDGAGVPGVVPPLRHLGLFLRTSAGRAYLVRVPGIAQAALDDERVAALLNWLLPEFSGAEPAPRYGAGEVRELRRDPLRDPIAERALALRR